MKNYILNYSGTFHSKMYKTTLKRSSGYIDVQDLKMGTRQTVTQDSSHGLFPNSFTH